MPLLPPPQSPLTSGALIERKPVGPWAAVYSGRRRSGRSEGRDAVPAEGFALKDEPKAAIGYDGQERERFCAYSAEVR